MYETSNVGKYQPVVIGIDHGFSLIKTYHHIMSNGVAKTSGRPPVLENSLYCEEPLEDCPPAYGVPETEPQGETVGLTVAMPLDKVLVGNLTNLLEAKGSLIKKALGISELPIIIDEEKISFPWFSDGLDADTVKAYTDFISALCKMSREQKRISNTEKAVENEKYAFRCLLLRLGFVGAEYKRDRKILLKNLTGSSAFKNDVKKEAADDEISE